MFKTNQSTSLSFLNIIFILVKAFVTKKPHDAPWSKISLVVITSTYCRYDAIRNKNKLNAQITHKYIQDNCYSYVQVFSDASKNIDNKVVAFTVPEFNVKINKRISDNLPAYTGEMIAILMAYSGLRRIDH